MVVYMERLLRPKEAAETLGISVRWLQEMDRDGKIKCIRTSGNRRRILLSEVNRLMGERNIRKVAVYARVSSQDQKEDLVKQKQLLLQNYPDADVYFDIRSGLKFDRKGFIELLKAVEQSRVSKVVVVHEDRLARFGIDLLRHIFLTYGTEIEILNNKEKGTPEEELAKDLITIITSFSARLYGLRSHKTKKLLHTAREVIKSEQ